MTPHKKIRSIDDFYLILIDKHSKCYIFEEKEVEAKRSSLEIVISGENEQELVKNMKELLELREII